jgi:hypothetical protein
MIRDHDVSTMTTDEMEHARRELAASLALMRPGSPARVPIENQLRAIDAAWETTVRTAANTMLRYPDKISDGLEAELYALLEKLDTTKAGQPMEPIRENPDDTP